MVLIILINSDSIFYILSFSHRTAFVKRDQSVYILAPLYFFAKKISVAYKLSLSTINLNHEKKDIYLDFHQPYFLFFVT